MSRILVRKGAGDSDKEAMRSFSGSSSREERERIKQDILDRMGISEDSLQEQSEMTPEERAKQLGEDVARQEANKRRKQTVNTGKAKEFSEDVLPNLNLGGASESSPTEAQPSAPMQPDAESFAIPPGFKHGLGARARKVLTEDGRLKRVIVENEEGGVQDAGISHNMLVQDPSGASPYFRSRKGPRDQIPMSTFLHRFMSKEPQRAAQLFGYQHLADRKTTTQDDRDERMQMQIGMALHAMREDPDVLANLVNAQGLAVTDKSIPATPEEALAQVKRNFPQVTVPSQQEQLAVEMMREHFPDAIPEGNPTLAAAFAQIDRSDEETMSAEDLQELTVGQGEKVDVQGVVQRKPDSETESSRLDQRIMNTFGADKAQANPDEFERFRNFAMERLDAVDLADDRARRELAESEEKRFEEQGGYGAGAQKPLMTHDKADEMFGTSASQFGFGRERTDDPIEDALQSAMMIHQRTEAQRPDDLTGIVQSDMQRQIEEAMQARGGSEGSANIDDAKSTAQRLREEVNAQRELIAEEGARTAQLRQRGRKNPIQEQMEADLERMIQERNNAQLAVQALIDERSGARRAAGTPAPTAGLAGLARDFQQGNVVDMENAPSELRVGAKRGGFDPNAPIQGLPSQARGAVMPVTDEQSAEARAFDSTLDRIEAVKPDEHIRRLNERGQRRDEKFEANTPALDFTQGAMQGETDDQRIARLINEAMNPTGGDDNVETGFPMSLGTQLLKGIQHDLYYKGV
jgi:hypothetical protein